MNVLISVPSNDMVHADFSMDLVNMCVLSALNGIFIAAISEKSSIVEVGRTRIAVAALNINPDYLFTVDSDMRFPPDTLLQLLKHKKDIVCCDAVKRREPHTQVIKGLDNKPIDYNNTEPLVEIKGGSTACKLIKIDVLRQLDPPYYAVTWEGINYTGEDRYFSEKVKKAGFKIYCDTRLSLNIGHIGTKTYYIKK